MVSQPGMALLGLLTIAAWGIGLWQGTSAFRRRGLIDALKRLVLAVTFASVGTLLGWLLLVLHAYHVFSGETLIAQVTTQRLSKADFELTYRPFDHGERVALRIRLQGDQWAISGGIVKWHPWLTALGLKSYHKPMRLMGQFSRVDEQRLHLPTVFPLEPGADRLWETLYRLDPYLPFIEAVYGSSAYVYVEPGSVQQIYVTPSGYMIKRF
ncbi:MAG: hypothetical protein HYS71_03600 [Candidatus Omnitrophica bacterium]|nr:hypothetical protein [Candidatus Omnitrophota bacterium]